MTNIAFHDIAAQAATRLNLAVGRDNVLRGQCPVCSYVKPSLTLKVVRNGVVISCAACGEAARIAATLGLPPGVLVADEPKSAKTAKALKIWNSAQPAMGTPAEAYLRGRAITTAIPDTIRFIPRLRNWTDGKTYPAMVSLVARVPGGDEPNDGQTVQTGVHLTYLSAPDAGGMVRKAGTEQSKLSLGQLRHGGVWLATHDGIHDELAVTEGIETALSVQQLTGLPTVAALSAAGMRSFRWPPQVRKLWICADNDPVGRQTAEMLLSRALRAGLGARIKVPACKCNDFNDFLRRN